MNNTLPLNLSDILSNNSMFFSRLSSDVLQREFRDQYFIPLYPYKRVSMSMLVINVVQYHHLVYEYLLLCLLMSNLTTGLMVLLISNCSSFCEVMSGTLQMGSASRSLRKSACSQDSASSLIQ